jgi:hypothetical protein
MTRRAESYLGGHTVIGPRSDWFGGRPEPKVIPKKRKRKLAPRPVSNAAERAAQEFRDAVVGAIGCSHSKAEQIRQLYIDKGWVVLNKLINPAALLDPEVLGKALAVVSRPDSTVRRYTADEIREMLGKTGGK